MGKSKPQVITTYKGFDKNLKCRDFQYEIGKTFKHEGEVERCSSGFHACEYPLDVLRYYSAAEGNRFAIVEQSGDLSREKEGDTKVASSVITVKAEIGVGELIKAAVDFTMSRAKKEKGATTTKKQGAVAASGESKAASATGYRGAASATGSYGAASATGYRGAASATGFYGAASATGYRGAASATGSYGAASATGDCGAASATGSYGAASATGDCGAASATGYRGAASATGSYGAASATGFYGAASATGYRGAASATGEKTLAASLGFEGRAKGAHGVWIVLVHRDSDWKITHIESACCGITKGVKADTWYSLDARGNFVEV